MTTAFLTHRLTQAITITSLAAAAILTGCGGDGDPADTNAAVPAYPTGPLGKVTALASGLFEPGTYPVSGCVAAGASTALQRKIRFNEDGSVDWLNAAANDAVLFTIAPSSTEREDRSLYYFRPDNWGASVVRFDAASGGVTAYFITRTNVVNVLYGNNAVQEDCPAAFNPTLRINNATVAARLGSAVALNGSGGLSGGPLTLLGVSYTSIGISAAGAITTQTAEPGSNPVAWGNWLSTVNTSSSNYYEERYFARNDATSASGTPAKPNVFVYMMHPSLQGQRSGSAPGTLTSVGFGLGLNNTGSGPAVVFDLSNN